MPNIKSAIKRVKVASKKTSENIMMKSNLKTSLKNFNEAISKDGASVKAEYSEITKTLDKAASRGIIHKNTAARKKSRLAKRISKIEK